MLVANFFQVCKAMEIPDEGVQVTLPPALIQVSELAEARPEAFIVGDEEMRAATLQAAKYVFDLCKFVFVLAHRLPMRN